MAATPCLFVHDGLHRAIHDPPCLTTFGGAVPWRSADDHFGTVGSACRACSADEVRRLLEGACFRSDRGGVSEYTPRASTIPMASAGEVEVAAFLERCARIGRRCRCQAALRHRGPGRHVTLPVRGRAGPGKAVPGRHSNTAKRKQFQQSLRSPTRRGVRLPAATAAVRGPPATWTSCLALGTPYLADTTAGAGGASSWRRRCELSRRTSEQRWGSTEHWAACWIRLPRRSPCHPAHRSRSTESAPLAA